MIYASTAFSLKDFAYRHHIPFFFKKWGNREDNGRMPREFPVFRKAADAVGTNPGGNVHNSLISDQERMGGTMADGKEDKSE